MGESSRTLRVDRAQKFTCHWCRVPLESAGCLLCERLRWALSHRRVTLLLPVDTVGSSRCPRDRSNVGAPSILMNEASFKANDPIPSAASALFIHAPLSLGGRGGQTLSVCALPAILTNSLPLLRHSLPTFSSLLFSSDVLSLV